MVYQCQSSMMNGGDKEQNKNFRLLFSDGYPRRNFWEILLVSSAGRQSALEKDKQNKFLRGCYE